MRIHAKVLTLALVIGLAPGCASEGGQQAVGAAVGGLTGGLICAAAGGKAGVCVAAAAGGAVLGWGAVKVTQVLSKREDIAAHPQQPAVVIRDYRLDPAQVQQGKNLTATTTYDLMTPAQVATRPVTQNFKLLKDGEEVLAFTPIQSQMTEHGRYHVSWEVPIPASADPGTYQLIQVLDAQTASPEIRSATFQVVKGTARLDRIHGGRG